VNFGIVKDYLRDTWVVAKAILGRPRRGKRTPTVVDRDYDSGDWQRLLTNRDWLPFNRLADYLAAPSITRSRIVDGRVTMLSGEAYNQEKIRHLSRITDVSRECIIEFGCGTGWNHLALRASGYRGFYLGLDISPSGILAAHQRSNHFHLVNHEFRTADMTDRRTWPSNSEVNYRNATGFSYLSLEQIPGLADIFLREAWLQGITRLYLFESSNPQASNQYSRVLTSIYLRAKDYQRDLSCVLSQLEKQGIVKGWNQSAPVLSPRLFNEVSVYSVYFNDGADSSGEPGAVQ
jgi:SAM-dependent methyltransferase